MSFRIYTIRTIFNQIILPLVLLVSTNCQSIAQGGQAGDLQTIKEQIFALINMERARSDGKAPDIKASDNLNKIAQTFADDMVHRHFFNHIDPDGNTCKERARRLKLPSPQAESILSGVIDGTEAVEEFMSDPPHARESSRANILNPDFRYLGIGVAQKASGTLVVVLEFAKK